MKSYLVISLFAICNILNAQTLTSPYVETNTLIINNTGFKSISIRTTPVAKPTPMHTQGASVNASFPARFVVAKADLSATGTWAWANGWLAAANSSVSGGVASVIPTGCAAYFEPGNINAIVGTWRLPTQREMNLIIISRFELANQNVGFIQLGANGTYWTSTQSNATIAWAITLGASSMYVRDKTLPLSVRCIRDL